MWAENRNFSAADFFPDLPETGLKSSKNKKKTILESYGNVLQFHKNLKNFVKPQKCYQRLTDRPMDQLANGPTDQWTNRPTDQQIG